MKHIFFSLLTILLLNFSVNSVAAPKDPAQKFAEQKQKIIERLQKRLACVSAAQNEMQLQACRSANDGELGRDHLFKGTGQDVIR